MILAKLEGVVKTFIWDTEDFFFKVECARESLRRMQIDEYPPDNHDNDTYVRRQVYREYQRLTQEYKLSEFNKIKRKIILLTADGRKCYVPPKVLAYLKDIHDTEENLSEEHWDHWNDRREPGYMIVWNRNKKPRRSG